MKTFLLIATILLCFQSGFTYFRQTQLRANKESYLNCENALINLLGENGESLDVATLTWSVRQYGNNQAGLAYLQEQLDAAENLSSVELDLSQVVQEESIIYVTAMAFFPNGEFGFGSTQFYVNADSRVVIELENYENENLDINPAYPYQLNYRISQESCVAGNTKDIDYEISVGNGGQITYLLGNQSTGADGAQNVSIQVAENTIYDNYYIISFRINNTYSRQFYVNFDRTTTTPYVSSGFFGDNEEVDTFCISGAEFGQTTAQSC